MSGFGQVLIRWFCGQGCTESVLKVYQKKAESAGLVVCLALSFSVVNR